jgi:hypothetical protein
MAMTKTAIRRHHTNEIPKSEFLSSSEGWDPVWDTVDTVNIYQLNGVLYTEGVDAQGKVKISYWTEELVPV